MVSSLHSALLPMVVLSQQSAQDLWVWGGATSPLKGETEAEAFLGFVGKQTTPLDAALVENEGLATDSTALAAFVERASLANPPFNVAALYGWSGSSSISVPTNSVLKWVDAAMDLRRTALAQGRPALFGISLDIEPKQPEQYQQYADLLRQIRDKLDGLAPNLGSGSDLRLDIAAAWGFHDHNISCGGDSNMTLMQCAIGLVDRYNLMNYRNSAHGCSCKPDKPNPKAWGCVNGSVIPTSCEVVHYPDEPKKDGMIGKALETAQAIAAGARARLALGVESNCGIGQYTYKLSFCGTSLDYLKEQQALTESWFREAGLWETVMDTGAPWTIEDYKGLQTLESSDFQRIV